MKIAIVSGKGGTGKTTVATSIVQIARAVGDTCFLDCDVEAPNAAIFLNPDMTGSEEVGILVPRINADLCSNCGTCAAVCEYNALASTKSGVLVFPEICHGCGSCVLICPNNAIEEEFHRTGVLEWSTQTDNFQFAHGKMNIGEPMAVPIIRQLKKKFTNGNEQTILIDSPPGASCPVVEALRGVDYAILVTEPTPFGLHDLKQIVGIVQDLQIRAGVIINRDGIGTEDTAEFCASQNLTILMRIPMDVEIAKGIADGKTLLDTRPDFLQPFENLFSGITEEVE